MKRSARRRLPTRSAPGVRAGIFAYPRARGVSTVENASGKAAPTAVRAAFRSNTERLGVGRRKERLPALRYIQSKRAPRQG